MTSDDESSKAWNEQRYSNDGYSHKEKLKHPPVILYRNDKELIDKKELTSINKYFVSTANRVKVHRGDLIIGRYSVLPFYKELEEDLLWNGCKLVNSFSQHRYVADLQNWYYDLESVTPKTWVRLEDVPDNGGPFVLKGETNSKKDKWLTHMFAQNKQEAVKVYMRLLDDSLISRQNIYVRQYLPLKKLGESLNGQPITNEFRVFVYNKQILAGGYYWSSHVDDLEVKPSFNCVPRDFLQRAINAVGDNIPFFVIDVCETESGEWVVIELNDGQMSGLSECSPDELYKNLKDYTWNNQV